MRPLFGTGKSGSFNRIEIAVPSADTRIDTLFFDGRAWTEIATATTEDQDPLANLQVNRIAPTTDGADSLGQFAQSVVIDPITQTPKLLIKLPPMRSDDFQFGQT